MTDSSPTQQRFLNVAAYLFVELDDLESLQALLRERSRELELRGTVLLAPEGINFFLSGRVDALREFVQFLRSDERFAKLEVKESFSDEIAFNRMLVKIKQEIIAFGVEGIRPAVYTSKRVSARQLQDWLNDDKDLVLLDVRNTFEWELGSFDGAEIPHVESFRDFPDAVQRLPEEWKQRPVVTFCTGGIRCEKAAPFLEQAGFKEVYQLDGGILKYFEECGSDHYHGECFVFDRRVGVDPDLEETDTTLCYACQHPLKPSDRQCSSFVPGKSCPFCADRQGDPAWRLMRQRQRGLRKFLKQLPGATPYENIRPIRIPERVDGLDVLTALQQLLPMAREEIWEERIQAGLIREGGRIVGARDCVRSGQSLLHVEPEYVEPDVNPKIEVLEEDDAWIVLNKPAPLPVHPSGRFHRNTLTWMLAHVDRGSRLRPAHRLDANTTGLQIICKNRDSARRVQEQFEQRTVEKSYLARVHGKPDWLHVTCDRALSDKAGPAGSREVIEDAVTDSQPARNSLPSETEFECLATAADGTTLVIAKPRTGRTNQIRLHLAYLQHSIVGDPMYHADGSIGEVQTIAVEDPPMMLHAWRLTLRHPTDGTTRTLVAPPPGWTEGLLGKHA